MGDDSDDVDADENTPVMRTKNKNEVTQNLLA